MTQEEAVFKVLTDLGINRLKRSGDNIIGQCPYHDDVKPSWGIHIEKLLFHCFDESCGKTGTIINLYSDIKKISIYETMKELSEKYLISFVGGSTSYNDLEKKSKVYFTHSLNERSSMVKSYLDSLDDYTHCRAMKDRGFSYDILEKYEFKYSSKDNSIVYPIKYKGLYIGFYKRFLTENNPNKHLVSFKKKHYLYGYDDVKPGDLLYVVESPSCCIWLKEMADVSAVATSGAFFSYRQLELIKTRTNRIVFAFDNDDAGMAVLKKALFLTRKKLLNREIYINIPILKDWQMIKDIDLLKQTVNKLIPESVFMLKNRLDK